MYMRQPCILVEGAAFTSAFHKALGRKLTAFLGPMTIASPVRGLRPLRVDLSRTPNVPKPVMMTCSPLQSVDVSSFNKGIWLRQETFVPFSRNDIRDRPGRT
jgi:hypothetical protein